MSIINMLIKNAMNTKVYTATEKTSVQDAAIEMTKHRIGSLIVVSQSGDIIGIITERDIMREVVARAENSNDIKVGEIMTKDIIIITPDKTLEDAAKVMTKNKIKKLPVLFDGKIVGIITASDLIAYEQKLVESVAKLMVSHDFKEIGG